KYTNNAKRLKKVKQHAGTKTDEPISFKKRIFVSSKRSRFYDSIVQKGNQQFSQFINRLFGHSRFFVDHGLVLMGFP
ncbi:MAG: hypothetical protein K8F24_10180, partial [Bacteroidales bacterium]|nr:hypothetical protein [Bacteroidales bacterium]